MADEGGSPQPSETSMSGQRQRKVPKVRLFLDPTESNLRIMDTLNKLQVKCVAWADNPLKAPPDFTYKMAPQPLHRVMTTCVPHNNTLSDYTALALRSVKRGKQLNGWKFDFEINNGLLRGTRIPRGKGVAIDAYGIRWIVVLSGRTLLTGESLVRVFPCVLGTDRPRFAPLVSLGQVTIPEDRTEDDYVLLPAQPELNQPYLSLVGDDGFGNAANRVGSWVQMDRDLVFFRFIFTNFVKCEMKVRESRP